MFKLGQKVRDKVSGYTGIAVSESRFLNGCVRISVQGKCKKDGTLPDTQWFDIQQIEVVGDGVDVTPGNTGGPVSALSPFNSKPKRS